MELGLDRLRGSSLAKRLTKAKVGLLAHPASVDRRLRHASDVLLEEGIAPRVFFGPEHGYGGEAQDMIGVASAKDARTGAPIVSLYGDAFEDLIPKAEHLAELDVLLVDLADVGSRYYTFIWTALLVARAAVRAGKELVILDRPNPVDGASIEGATQKKGFLSFVGLEPVPVRHAMTLAEIVCYFAAREGLPLGAGGVGVVPLAGWDRASLADAWDRPFVMPSPNMPTATTALVYPGGCLLEGTNLSEGRGTTRPFELVGAPWIDGRELAAKLSATGLPGFVARPVTFLPTFQKHAKQLCGGVQLHVTDARTFRPYATYLALTALAHAQAPSKLRFRTERYEYVDDIPAFDLLTGSAEAREAILRGEDARALAEAVSAADPAWRDALGEARERVRAASLVD